MGRGHRDRGHSLAATLGRRRDYLPPDSNPFRSSRGENQADGGIAWSFPDTQAHLRLDGAVVWGDGTVYDSRRMRDDWPSDERPYANASDYVDVIQALRSLSAAAPSLALREKAALLDALAGDLRATERLTEAMMARRLSAGVTVWWAPDPRDTGITDLAAFEYPDQLRPWRRPIDASAEDPAEAAGPLYRLHLQKGVPAIWAPIEVGPGGGDLLLTPPGLAIYPSHVGEETTRAGIRQVITASAAWDSANG